MKRRIRPLFLLGLFFLVALVDRPESLAAPYYAGKMMRIVVGAATGGAYDRNARLMAKHLPKYIPGAPTFIIENMVGASSIIAANHVYNIAKPDGLTIGIFNRALPFTQLVKVEGVKFDITKFSWLGSVTVEPSVLALRTDLPYKTLDDLRKTKEPIPIGCSGISNQDAQFPLLLKEFCGLNISLVVYKSANDALLSVERNEAQGKAGAYSDLKSYITRGLVRPWIRGRISMKEIDHLPMNEDLTNDKTGKTIMAMYSVSDILGRFYVAPPGTPAGQVNILREAFAKVVKDPEFLADAKKLLIDIKFTPPEEVLKVVTYTMNQPPAVIKEFSKYVKF